MLKNGMVTAFTASELLRGKQQGVGGGDVVLPPPTQIRAKILIIFLQIFLPIFLGKNKNP